MAARRNRRPTSRRPPRSCPIVPAQTFSARSLPNNQVTEGMERSTDRPGPSPSRPVRESSSFELRSHEWSHALCPKAQPPCFWSGPPELVTPSWVTPRVGVSTGRVTARASGPSSPPSPSHNSQSTNVLQLADKRRDGAEKREEVTCGETSVTNAAETTTRAPAQSPDRRAEARDTPIPSSLDTR